MLVRQTEQAAMASAHSFERRILWLSCLLAIGSALLARRIVQPLKMLSGAIEDIAQTPTHAVPSAIPEVKSFHEAHVLSDALRGLMRSERSHREALEGMNAQLEETVAARTAEPACADADAARIDGQGGAPRPHVRRAVSRYGWLQAGQRHAWP